MHVGMVLLAEISPKIVLSPNLEKKKWQHPLHIPSWQLWIMSQSRGVLSASSHISAIMSPLSCVGVHHFPAEIKVFVLEITSRPSKKVHRR